MVKVDWQRIVEENSSSGGYNAEVYAKCLKRLLRETQIENPFNKQLLRLFQDIWFPSLNSFSKSVRIGRVQNLQPKFLSRARRRRKSKLC